MSEEDTVTIEKNSKVEENHTEMKDDVILKTERTCILGTYLTWYFILRSIAAQSQCDIGFSLVIFSIFITDMKKSSNMFKMPVRYYYW